MGFLCLPHLSIAAQPVLKQSVSGNYLPSSANLAQKKLPSFLLEPLNDTSHSPPPPGPGLLHEAADGPWGSISYHVAYLVPPDSLEDHIEIPSDITKWHFPYDNLRDAAKDLLQCGLTPDDLKWMNNAGYHRQDNRGTHLFPPVDFLQSLTPRIKTMITEMLGKHPGNTYYKAPYLVESGNAESWFSDAGLSSNGTRLAASLCYTISNQVFLSDVPYLMTLLDDPADQWALTRALNIQHSLIAKLDTSDPSRKTEIMGYWTNHSNHAQAGAILEAAFSTDGVKEVDLLHLLPPGARRLVNTFPDPSMGAGGRYPDCHWTMANFFLRSPSPRFLDTESVMREISRHYKAAEQPLMFGDVIFLFDQGTRDAVHSSIYLAADLVFTKNGRNLARPWVIMRYKDMTNRYSFDRPLDVEVYRLKDYLR